MRTTGATAAPVPIRLRILDEAERLIAAKGVYGFTLQDIAGPLGVRVPAIYKHYDSRDDVLIEVSRRFITLLAAQFEVGRELAPVAELRAGLDALVELMLHHPAYVRLALVDFATPGGGMEYVKLAAGGSFKQNFRGGPLAAMHTRLRRILASGVRSGDFRPVDASVFYGLVKGSLLIRLVFPDDLALLRRPSTTELRRTQRWLRDVAMGYLAPRTAAVRAAHRAGAPARRARPALRRR
jgi:AcrR family transcriptional regulator